MALEKMQHWTIQVVTPEGLYGGADELIDDLSALVEGESEIEIISAEESQGEE